MIGQQYSFSARACYLLFEGGPADGEIGLFDHEHFVSIQKFDWPSGEYVKRPGCNFIYEWREFNDDY